VKKYAVVFALFILSMITYIDRVCISAAKTPIAAELQLSDTAIGLVFSVFALGYALAQIPAGWFADKFGPRNALVGVVGAWSVFTALTGASWSLTSLVAIRFLFGVAEAGAFPGSARAIRNWLPAGERGLANGILFSGSRLGAAVSFPLLAWMLSRWSWRASFLILGIAGLSWAAFWLLWFRNRPTTPLPEDHSVTVEPSLGVIFRSKAMLLAMTQYFASNFTFFLCLSWMLPYLKKQYLLSDSTAAAYAMTPLLFGATSQWLAGWLVDRIYHSPLHAWSRRLPGMLGFGLGVIGLLAVTRATTPDMAVLYFALAVFGTDMTISPSWVFCSDVAGKNTGAVSGAMNMLGNIGSFASANAFPYLERMTGSASAYFAVAATLNLIGAVCWFHMRSTEHIPTTEAEAHP